MSKTGPIIIIEDDIDDKEIFENLVADLKIQNRIEWFPETQSAMEFLIATTEAPFLIFCDINLPGMSGLEFKRKIDANPELRKKSIPFVFLSTSATQKDVSEAFTEMVVQGFFKKPTNYNEFKSMLASIFDYWCICRHPNMGDSEWAK